MSKIIRCDTNPVSYNWGLYVNQPLDLGFEICNFGDDTIIYACNRFIDTVECLQLRQDKEESDSKKIMLLLCIMEIRQKHCSEAPIIARAEPGQWMLVAVGSEDNKKSRLLSCKSFDNAEN